MPDPSPGPAPAYCPACQAELPRGAKFCWLCGLPMLDSPSHAARSGTFGRWALAVLAALLIQFVVAPLLITAAVVIGFAILCSTASR